MKRIRNVLLAAALACSCIALAGCTSEEAKAVIDEIDAIGEVSLGSVEAVQSANESYSMLSDSDKKSIKNYSVLEEANEELKALQIAEINRAIEEDCADLSEVDKYDYHTLRAAADYYDALDEDERAQVSGYETLEKALAKSAKLEAESQCEYVVAYSSVDATMSMAESTFNEYRDIMDEEQVATCLFAMNRDLALEKCDACVKSYLKNPSSYTRYDESIGYPSKAKNGGYKARVTVMYRATNSFNAIVSNKMGCEVEFTVDCDSYTIQFTGAEPDAYYSWKLAS